MLTFAPRANRLYLYPRSTETPNRNGTTSEPALSAVEGPECSAKRATTDLPSATHHRPSLGALESQQWRANDLSPSELRVQSSQSRKQSEEARRLLRRGRDGLRRPVELTLPDDQHSEDEDRLIIVGVSASQRLLFVVYTEDDSRIRIIGARLVTGIERQQYEQS